MPFQIFNGVYETFVDTHASMAVFKSDIYLRKAKERLSAALAGNFVAHDYVFVPMMSALLAERKVLSILDFGGGPGISYLSLRHALKSTVGLTYHVLDSAEVCELGRKNLTGDSCIEFFEDAKDVNAAYDVTHLGSVLQYVEDVGEVASFLKSKRCQYVLVSDAMIGTARTFVTVANYYGHLHPHRFHNYQEFVDLFAAAGFELFSSVRHVPKIGDSLKFYDMSNLPPDCRTSCTYHLMFRSADRAEKGRDGV